MYQKDDCNSSTIRFHEQTYEKGIHRHNRYFSQVPCITKQTQRIASERINYNNQDGYAYARKSSVNSVSKDNEVNQLEKEYQRLIKKSKCLLEANTNLTKHQIIRITRWLAKFQIRPSNIIWKKNINFYLKVIIQMMIQNKIMEPFTNVPKDGQLPKLTIYDVPFPIRTHLQRIMLEQYDKRSNYSKGKSSKGQVFQRLVKKSDVQTIIDDRSCIFDKQLIPMDGNMQNSYYQQSSEVRYAPQQIDFSEYSVNINMPIVPCFTNHKSKKKNQNPRKSSNTAKISEISKIDSKTAAHLKGNITINPPNLDENKENHPLAVNSSNITRKLFKSKEKIISYPVKFKDSERIIQNNQNMAQEQDKHPADMQKGNNEKGFQILMRAADFINRNQANFIHRSTSVSLSNKIMQLGAKIHAKNQSHVRLQQNLDISIMSEKSLAFVKASEQIRNKFSETDQQTIQFLSFLKNLKNRVQI